MRSRRSHGRVGVGPAQRPGCRPQRHTRFGHRALGRRPRRPCRTGGLGTGHLGAHDRERVPSLHLRQCAAVLDDERARLLRRHCAVDELIRSDHSPSYLKDTLTFARYALTTPLSMTRSSCAISATRRSRNVFEALVTAAAAAFSQLSVLVPTNSMIL